MDRWRTAIAPSYRHRYEGIANVAWRFVYEPNVLGRIYERAATRGDGGSIGRWDKLGTGQSVHGYSESRRDGGRQLDPFDIRCTGGCPLFQVYRNGDTRGRLGNVGSRAWRLLARRGYE